MPEDPLNYLPSKRLTLYTFFLSFLRIILLEGCHLDVRVLLGFGIVFFTITENIGVRRLEISVVRIRIDHIELLLSLGTGYFVCGGVQMEGRILLILVVADLSAFDLTYILVFPGLLF